MLLGVGVVGFIQSWRQARQISGEPKGIERLRRLHFRLMAAILGLAPLLWVLLQFSEGDAPFIFVGVVAAIITLVLLPIALVLGWHDGGNI